MLDPMILIQRGSGEVVPGILIASNEQRIRVALKGAEDLAEHRLLDRRWVSEDCAVVTIALADAGAPAEVAPRIM